MKKSLFFKTRGQKFISKKDDDGFKSTILILVVIVKIFCLTIRNCPLLLILINYTLIQVTYNSMIMKIFLPDLAADLSLQILSSSSCCKIAISRSASLRCWSRTHFNVFTAYSAPSFSARLTTPNAPLIFLSIIW